MFKTTIHASGLDLSSSHVLTREAAGWECPTKHSVLPCIRHVKMMCCSFTIHVYQEINLYQTCMNRVQIMYRPCTKHVSPCMRSDMSEHVHSTSISALIMLLSLQIISAGKVRWGSCKLVFFILHAERHLCWRGSQTSAHGIQNQVADLWNSWEFQSPPQHESCSLLGLKEGLLIPLCVVCIGKGHFMDNTTLSMHTHTWYHTC
jgi:hypothetical protein